MAQFKPTRDQYREWCDNTGRGGIDDTEAMADCIEALRPRGQRGRKPGSQPSQRIVRLVCLYDHGTAVFGAATARNTKVSKAHVVTALEDAAREAGHLDPAVYVLGDRETAAGLFADDSPARAVTPDSKAFERMLEEAVEARLAAMAAKESE
jgi:hypothetical protein